MLTLLLVLFRHGLHGHSISETVSTSLHADADATRGGLRVQVADRHFLQARLLWQGLAIRQGTWVALVSGSTATMQVPT